MKISPFQAVVLAFFSIAIIAGVIVLSMTKSGGTGNTTPVVIWGTMSDVTFNDAVADLTQGNNGLKITYIQKQSDSFDRELIEALASSAGPDAIILPQDLIIRYRNKIFPIPFSSMPITTFKNTFVQESELFLDSAGIIALPFSLDPLVMYWNRDLFANIGASLPPKTWDEFITLAPKLSTKDKNLNILHSAVSLGEFSNITNAKEIISAFLMQAGNPITQILDGALISSLAPSNIGSIGAINFYTDFANPVKPDYSWNRALPKSADMFVSGDLAVYFGFASEALDIRNKNPNLNFDVTFFPQPKGAKTAITFGRMQGLAVLKNSPNASSAFQTIIAITGDAPLARLSKSTGLPPVLRTSLVADPSDPFQSVFFNSAIRARAWLDPNPTVTKTIFKNMIESITSGEFEVGKAIDVAGSNLSGISRSL